jgi:hypothetical protein
VSWLLALALLGAGPGKVTTANPKPKPGGPALALVGNDTLTRDELMILFRGQVPSDVPRDKLQAVLESWANGELWYQEAVRQGIGQDETTQLAMRNEEHNIIAQMLLRRIQDTLSVTDTETRAYFNQHQDDYAISTSITYLYLFDSSLAAGVLDQVRSGASLQAASAPLAPDQFSLGEPTPYFVRNDSAVSLLQISPELNQTIFSLQKGDVSGVVKVNLQGKNTFWIIKCLDRKRVKPSVKFDDVQQDIRDELLPAKQQVVADSVSTQLGRKTRVEIMTDNFYGSSQAAPAPAGK